MPGGTKPPCHRGPAGSRTAAWPPPHVPPTPSPAPQGCGVPAPPRQCRPRSCPAAALRSAGASRGAAAAAAPAGALPSCPRQPRGGDLGTLALSRAWARCVWGRRVWVTVVSGCPSRCDGPGWALAGAGFQEGLAPSSTVPWGRGSPCVPAAPKALAHFYNPPLPPTPSPQACPPGQKHFRKGVMCCHLGGARLGWGRGDMGSTDTRVPGPGGGIKSSHCHCYTSFSYVMQIFAVNFPPLPFFFFFCKYCL